MKKAFRAIFACVFAVLFSVSASAVPFETDDGIFYSAENGEVTIEGFNYAGTTMDVPEEIDGMPVRYIAPQACRGNTAIHELYLPSTLISIGEYAFAECPNLTKVVMSGGNEVGFSGFRGCAALMSLSLPDSLETIHDSAFEGCTMLGKVKIPSSLSEIGVDAFAGCDRIRFDISDNPYAKEYAKQYSIPTSFVETWEFTLILLAITTALLGGGLYLINRIIKNRRLHSQKEKNK